MWLWRDRSGHRNAVQHKTEYKYVYNTHKQTDESGTGHSMLAAIAATKCSCSFAMNPNGIAVDPRLLHAAQRTSNTRQQQCNIVASPSVGPSHCIASANVQQKLIFTADDFNNNNHSTYLSSVMLYTFHISAVLFFYNFVFFLVQSVCCSDLTVWRCLWLTRCGTRCQRQEQKHTEELLVKSRRRLRPPTGRGVVS